MNLNCTLKLKCLIIISFFVFVLGAAFLGQKMNNNLEELCVSKIGVEYFCLPEVKGKILKCLVVLEEEILAYYEKLII